MLITIGARMGGKVINLIVFLVLARTLSVEDLGWFGFVYTTSFIMTAAFDVGVRNSVAYYIGRRPGDLSAFTSHVFLLWSLLGVLSVAGLVVFFQLTARPLLALPLFAPSAALILGMLFMRMGQGVLLGQGRIAFFNQTELAARIVLAAITFGLLWIGSLTLSGAIWAYAGSQLAASAVLAGGMLGQATRINRKDLGLGFLLLRRGFLFMIGVLLMIASKRIAFMMLSQLGTGEELGLFYGVQRLTEILIDVALAVSVVVFSQNVRATRREEAVAGAAQSTRMTLAVFVAVALVVIPLGPWLVPLALGPEYAHSIGMFNVLLLGTLIGSVWTILFPSLSAITSPIVPALIFLPNVAVNLMAAWWFYTRMGAIGAAWALALSHAVLSASYLAAFQRMYGARIRDFLLPRREDFAGAARQLARVLGRRSAPASANGPSSPESIPHGDP